MQTAALRQPVFDVIAAERLSPIALAMLPRSEPVPSPRMVLALALAFSLVLHLWLLPKTF